MSQAGIPVPAGFTVTTDSCARYYDDNKIIADEIISEIKDNINRIEILTGKTFGGADNPLLLSVRSNSRQSVPGLMETILHLGMNDTTAESLSIRMSDPKTAYEYYLNFISVYSAMVKRFGKKQYASILEDYKSAAGKFRDEDLTLYDLKELISLYKESYKKGLGEAFPNDPFVQLINAIGAGFHYWDSPRANYYRMVKEIPYSWGTAVTVQTMVYGNFLGERSGTGVAFTRNPSDGKKERLGEFLLNSRTGDVLIGNRTPNKLDVLIELMPDVYEEFERDCFLIENKYRDIYEINFTIEDGNFFIIKTRKAKRTALAAFTAACDFTDEGMCSEKDAIKVLDPANITSLRPSGGYEQLFEDSDDDVSFEPQDMYTSDKNAVGYVAAVTTSDETTDTALEEDENSGGIYNFSLFDYELDDIMTEIYSGFNVYDEDVDDTSLTDELKRIVTERIPSLNVDDIPEETDDTEKTSDNIGSAGDDLAEIEVNDEARYSEFSGYSDSLEMLPVGIFNDALETAKAMAAEMNFAENEYPASTEPQISTEENDSEIPNNDSEPFDDSYYKTKAFSDELSVVDEELAEDDIEKRLKSGNFDSDGSTDEFDLEPLEDIPEELDPFMPLPEPPLTTPHAEEQVFSPDFTEQTATNEPIGAHKRHILATSPLDRIFSVINTPPTTVSADKSDESPEENADKSEKNAELDDISDELIFDENIYSDNDFYREIPDTDDFSSNDISKDVVKDDGTVYSEFSPETLINVSESEENYGMFELNTDEFDDKNFNPEDEINIPDNVDTFENFSDDDDEVSGGFLFDEDFDIEDDLLPPASFEDEIAAVSPPEEVAEAAEEVAEVTEITDEVTEITDEITEVTDEFAEVTDEVTEAADEVAIEPEVPQKTAVSTDELLNMINKATAKPHKIRVVPVKKK
jgi:hypothetical protein